MQRTYDLPDLPMDLDFSHPRLLLTLNSASRALAELKGTAKTIPNEQILISTLTLREAEDSSAIENIITTQDELFRSDIGIDTLLSSGTKEVQRYALALRRGFTRVQKNGFISRNFIIEVQQELEQNSAGIRRTPGTKLTNDRTGEVVYVPPQHPDAINRLLDNLVQFINRNELSQLDPLIKMAIIHHQFESIHPFYDGNGRTGRIINILYLVQQGLLDLPILYLSQYIIRTKGEYYRLLQAVRDENAWEDWIVYMLRGVAQTATSSMATIAEIRRAMRNTKALLRGKHPKVYSQDLLNNIFRHPYTKVDLVAQDLQVHTLTARKYLAILVREGVLAEKKVGRSLYFVNLALLKILARK